MKNTERLSFLNQKREGKKMFLQITCNQSIEIKIENGPIPLRYHFENSLLLP